MLQLKIPNATTKIPEINIKKKRDDVRASGAMDPPPQNTLASSLHWPHQFRGLVVSRIHGGTLWCAQPPKSHMFSLENSL